MDEMDSIKKESALFAEEAMKRCNKEQLQKLIAELTYTIIGEFSTSLDSLKKDYLPK